jgi:hypothetical protein
VAEMLTEAARAVQLYETLCTVDEGTAVALDVRPGVTRTVVVYDPPVPANRLRPVFTHGGPMLSAFLAGVVSAAVICWATL